MLLNYWLLFVLFLNGTAIGSFINVLEMRLKDKSDIVRKRSHCPKCKNELKVLDLVPIVSFALLGGKCRYCETKVSWQYPIIEFLSGLLFFASGCYVNVRMQISGFSDLVVMLCISFFLGLVLTLFLFIALYDMKHQIVPNKVIYPALATALIINVFVALSMHFAPNSLFFQFVPNFSLLWNIISAFIGGIFIAVIIILTKGKGMGGGDLKLLVLMGLILGPRKLLVAFYIAIFSGTIVGIVWGLKKGKIKGLMIPFGTFLSVGAIISVLHAEWVWNFFFAEVV